MHPVVMGTYIHLTVGAENVQIYLFFMSRDDDESIMRSWYCHHKTNYKVDYSAGIYDEDSILHTALRCMKFRSKNHLTKTNIVK